VLLFGLFRDVVFWCGKLVFLVFCCVFCGVEVLLLAVFVVFCKLYIVL
jgi:hypothetical protein